MEELKSRFVKVEQTITALIELVKSNHAVLNALVKLVDERFAKIEERFAKMDLRFEKIELRLGTMESQLNILTGTTSSNFGNVGDKLDSIAVELSKIEITTRYEQEYQDLMQFPRLIK